MSKKKKPYRLAFQTPAYPAGKEKGESAAKPRIPLANYLFVLAAAEFVSGVAGAVVVVSSVFGPQAAKSAVKAAINKTFFIYISLSPFAQRCPDARRVASGKFRISPRVLSLTGSILNSTRARLRGEIAFISFH